MLYWGWKVATQGGRGRFEKPAEPESESDLKIGFFRQNSAFVKTLGNSFISLRWKEGSMRAKEAGK